MLTDEIIDDYLAPLHPNQREGIRALRTLLLDNDPALVEAIDDGKWFRGLLTYYTPTGEFLYALGPRAGDATTFHMMAYYVSPALQERHGPALKRFLTGKSCMQFRRYSELPEDALRDIVHSSKEIVKTAMQMRDAQKKRKRETITG